MVVAAAQPYPFVKDHFTPQQVEAQAAWLVKCADEYGIELSRWLGEGGGRMMLWFEGLMVFGAPVLGCWAAYKASLIPPADTPPAPASAPTPTPSMGG